jgi:hypothetical protein
MDNPHGLAVGFPDLPEGADHVTRVSRCPNPAKVAGRAQDNDCANGDVKAPDKVQEGHRKLVRVAFSMRISARQSLQPTMPDGSTVGKHWSEIIKHLGSIPSSPSPRTEHRMRCRADRAGECLLIKGSA